MADQQQRKGRTKKRGELRERKLPCQSRPLSPRLELCDHSVQPCLTRRGCASESRVIRIPFVVPTHDEAFHHHVDSFLVVVIARLLVEDCRHATGPRGRYVNREQKDRMIMTRSTRKANRGRRGGGERRRRVSRRPTVPAELWIAFLVFVLRLSALCSLVQMCEFRIFALSDHGFLPIRDSVVECVETAGTIKIPM